MEKITVTAAALRQLLIAAAGPGYLMRELQAIRSLGGQPGESPIDLLLKEFNSWAKAQSELNALGNQSTKDQNAEAPEGFVDAVNMSDAAYYSLYRSHKDQYGNCNVPAFCRDLLTRSVQSQALSIKTSVEDAGDGKSSGPDPAQCNEAVTEAVNAIYFNDSSDYLSALYSVVKALAPQLMDLIQRDPAAAFEHCQSLSAKKNMPSAHDTE